MILNFWSVIPTLLVMIMIFFGMSYLNIDQAQKIRLRLFEDPSFTEDEHKLAYHTFAIFLIAGAVLIAPTIFLFNGPIKLFVSFIVFVASALLGKKFGDDSVIAKRNAASIPADKDQD